MNIGPMWLGWQRINSDLRACGMFSACEIEMFRLMFMWGGSHMMNAMSRGSDATESACAEMQDLEEHARNYPARRRPELRVVDGGGDDKAERKSAVSVEIRTSE